MAVGVLAVGAVGVLVVRAVTGGSGGASSPEAAVEDLAAALEEEDPVAALAAMDPDEVEALGDVYEQAAARAAAIGFAPGEATLAGVDVALSGVTYDVEELGDGVARVTITDGEADLTVDGGTLGDRTEAVLERQAEADGGDPDGDRDGELEAEDLVVTDDDGDEVEPFVVTVERGGGWYVSPLHTAAQYAVDALGLDAPTFPAPDGGEGAADPEAAVMDLLVAAGDGDGEATGELAAGAGGEAVRAYAGALEGLVGRLGEDTSAEVDVLETEVAERDGGGRRVTITRLEGTLTYTDDDGEERRADVSWDGTCLDVETRSLQGDGEAMTDDEEDAATVATSDLCLTEGWERIGIDSLSVVVVEEDGGWRVDPLATLTDYADDVVPEVDGATVLRLLDVPELAEPTGSVAVGSPTDVELNDAGYAVLTLEATAGEAFTVSAELPDDVDDELQAFLVAPDGSALSAFDLVDPEESGEYLLVVGKDGFSAGTATVRTSRLVRRDLTVGEAASGGLGQPGDVVEYAVDLEADATYRLVYNQPDLLYSVVDPDGLSLELTEGDEDGTATFTTDEAGTHAVRVESGSDATTGAFRVNVVEVPPFVLGNGTSAEASGEVLAPGDSQFIDLTVQGGREVLVDVVADAPAFDPVFIVKDPATDTELRRFNSGGPGAGESVSFAPEETTTYRIEVQGSASTVGPFTLTAELVA
ncbi:hypothetical protein PO878_11715 [Iamia majanohamensis]|uniref:Uncharacterized protein n=1 Tax=Iamia majanohamensis TaxID=467976 RepID=A0AAE9Y2T9_9ACTN|nr:hypothetical protein [Iamia majanohamensis]WCO65165.1 hypothetical protein PO878_11715 [Iamia majanohamensis]